MLSLSGLPGGVLYAVSKGLIGDFLRNLMYVQTLQYRTRIFEIFVKGVRVLTNFRADSRICRLSGVTVLD
jgi:hypothetical protein